MTAAERARLAVVLVGARNPHNIGAAARALRDFGFSDLRIVNDFAAPFEAAQIEAAKLETAQIQPSSAVAAASVMRDARRFNSLAEALADCTLIAGTTAIGARELRQPVLPLQQAAPKILAALRPGAPGPASGTREAAEQNPQANLDTGEEPTPRVALLFGSEKTGLTNDQLSHCSLLTTIPMFAPPDERHLSMNLGQSVAVCLYELTREGLEDVKEIPILHEAPATSADRELLTQLLLDVLHATGYTRRFPANSAEPLIRRLALQLGVSHREAMTWMGVLRQILWRERKEL
jgi:tRNA C32,U32 (ribose-2'-O)-methylase TrmJ